MTAGFPAGRYWAALALLLGLALCGPRPAAAEVPVPPLSGHVVDQTGLLTPAQQAALEQKLAAFEARKGSQLAVLVVATTAPETIEQYGLRVAERWKLGRAKVDDGAILLVARDDRTLRIEVGYGLEGALNDATAKRIIDDIIVPRFRQGDFAGGIAAGVESMIRVVDGEPLPAPAGRSARGGTIERYVPVLFVVALAAGGLLRALLGPFPGALATGGIVALIAWLLAGALVVGLIAGVVAFVFTLGGGMGGPLGGFGRGGFGGGLGGGGFSGGGGGFGGGGASGRW